MNLLGSVLALAGLVLAVALFAREDVGAIAALLVVAGPGLVLASLVHIVPMAMNAHAWQRLWQRPGRLSLLALTWATWLREAVNALLPVARIGGEIVAYRSVRGAGAGSAEAAATLVVDMALSILSQAGFAIVGLAGLLAVARVPIDTLQIALAVVALIVAGLAFIAVQRAGTLSAIAARLNRWAAGRLVRMLAGTMQIDSAIRAVYARRRDVVACTAWQCAAWMAGAAEIWAALYFLGAPCNVVDAAVIEALVQAASSAAFVVPGALGVQEGAFVVIGAALGIDGATALALAAARRMRDLVVFLPGLLAWQWEEARLRRMPSR